MANTQTSVPVFTSGQVLTAQQQTEINTGIPVFADSSARDASFGGTGEKVLAEGQFAFLEDTDTTQYYDGSTWQAVGGASGLTLVSATTFSAVTSVSVNSCFTSTYANYRVVFSNMTYAAPSGTTNTSLRMRAAGTDNSSANYDWARVFAGSTSTVGGGASIAATSFLLASGAGVVTLEGSFDMLDPQNTAKTGLFAQTIARESSTAYVTNTSGLTTVTTSYDGFTLLCSNGNFAGTVRVYGYQNSQEKLWQTLLYLTAQKNAK